MVDVLLSFPYIEINARCSKGNTALHLAVENNDIQMIKKLLDRGASIDVVNDSRKTIFHLDNPDLLKILK